MEKPSSKKKESFVTADVVSKWLRVSAKTVTQWAENKEIPAVKVGTEWKFRESDLTAWVTKKQTQKNKRSNKK